MSGLVRSLKYASFRAVRVLGVTLLMAVAFIFYFMLIESTSFTLSHVLERFPYMLLFLGNLMFMIYGMLDVATYTQLTMTYGCTRKNAVLSTVYMNLLEIFSAAVILTAYCVLVPCGKPHEQAAVMCISSLALFFFGGGWAMIGGILIHRFGKAAYIVMVLFSTIAGCAIGFASGFYGGTYVLLEKVVTLPMQAIMLAGVLWFAAASVISWLASRRMEVRV
jgi:hypothetical protein